MIKEIEEELGFAFTPEQTACLVKVLDRIWQKEIERADAMQALQQGLAALTEEVSRLTAAQQATDQRLAEFERRTEERFAALAGFQARTEQRLEELAAAQARTEQRLEELAAAQARTEQRLEELAAAQARTEQRLEELAAALAHTDTLVADLRGWQLELRYQERARAYFGPLLRHLRVLSVAEMEEEVEPHLAAAEYEDLLQVDLLLTGQPRHLPEAPPVWLVVEASAVVDRNDVERALRRAAALQKAGFQAIPTVAGEQLTAGAEEEVQKGHLLVLQDGRSRFWREALAAALAD